MKKYIMIAATLIFGTQVQAKSFLCITSPITTTYLFEMGPEKSHLTVMHRGGPQNAPLVTGVVTGASFGIIQERLGYVEKMGKKFVVSFDTKNCRTEKDYISCYNSEPAKIGDLEVKSYYFSIYKETSTSRYGTFSKFNVGFDYRVGVYSHRMGLDYYDQGCTFF